MNGGLMDKDILGTVVWDDEPEALFGVKPLHCSGIRCIRKESKLVA
jgi:hypothetical protein